jgi:tRNA A-37 threonylcarbamoyl transferase component Bud32
MHKAGYIHNDIHARNVFVNAGINGSVEFYLGDFGFAKASKDPDAATKELRGLGNLSRLVTRDRLRGILYKMVADGRVDIDIVLNTSSASSSVWKDDVGYSSRDLL